MTSFKVGLLHATFLVGVILIFDQARAQTTGRCSNGWTSFQTSKNQMTCIWLSNAKASWIDSMSYCKLMGAQLVELGSFSFNSQIAQLIQMKQTGKYWIGLSDIENEMNYKWMTSLVSPQTTFFKPGQQMSGLQKNCVSTDEKGEWTVEPCKTELFFLCQKL